MPSKTWWWQDERPVISKGIQVQSLVSDALRGFSSRRAPSEGSRMKSRGAGDVEAVLAARGLCGERRPGAPAVLIVALALSHHGATGAQGPLPVAMRDKLVSRMLVRKERGSSRSGRLRRWGLLLQSPSRGLSTGRGFYTEAEGQQNKGVKGRGRNALYLQPAWSFPTRTWNGRPGLPQPGLQ